MAHRDKFSHDWWKRHDRIEAIGKQLNRLWDMRRLELAGTPNEIAVDRITDGHFDDYRERAGEDRIGVWRIQDETAYDSHWMTIEHGLLENRVANTLKNPSRKQTAKPNIGARRRKKAAAIAML